MDEDSAMDTGSECESDSCEQTPLRPATPHFDDDPAEARSDESDFYADAEDVPLDGWDCYNDEDVTTAKRVDTDSESDEEPQVTSDDHPAVYDTPVRTPRPQRERRLPARYRD